MSWKYYFLKVLLVMTLPSVLVSMSNVCYLYMIWVHNHPYLETDENWIWIQFDCILYKIQSSIDKM